MAQLPRRVGEPKLCRMFTRALWYTGPGQAELRTESLPIPGTEQVQVQARFSAISRGTEGLVFRGQIPASEHERMRAPFQDGSFPFPVKYGYASVGQSEGRDVFCLYPHQAHYVVPRAATIAVPADVPPERAVLAANMETALNAIWDASLGAGDRVCVIGAGVVGALCAYLAARHPGCEVDVIELDAARGPIVEALGARLRTRDEYDVVLHASGQPEGLATALSLAGFEARIVELSWYGAREVALPLGGAFHARRLQIVSSQVGHVAPARRARWTHRRRLEKALSLLADPVLDVLFGEDVAFACLPDALAGVFGGGSPCTRVIYSEDEG
ncbi:MAG TPA: zinc-binding alcohol dehydrogenase [Polyangiales bacterium]|nr:zinc-binding alcohol dehydrogenase [Polyangiales bacterium]